MVSTFEATPTRKALPTRPTNVWVVAAFVVSSFGLYEWYVSPMVSLPGLHDWHVSPVLPILNGIFALALALVMARQTKQKGQYSRTLIEFARAFTILWTAVHVVLLLSGS